MPEDTPEVPDAGTQRTSRRASVPWGTVIGVSGILIGAAIAFYIYFSQTRKAVVVEVLSQTDVLDVRRNVPELSVTYAGADLEARNLNLRIYHIAIRNTGPTDILPSHFDTNIPWGFRVTPGEVITASLIDASSDYLSGRAEAPQVDRYEGRVHVSQVMLDSGTHITYEVLVLHPRDADPEVSALGKISGLAAIPVRIRETGPPSEVERTAQDYWLANALSTLLSAILAGLAGMLVFRYIAQRRFGPVLSQIQARQLSLQADVSAMSQRHEEIRRMIVSSPGPLSEHSEDGSVGDSADAE